jgi:hypothetical protein
MNRHLKWLIVISLLVITAAACSPLVQKVVIVVTATPGPQVVAQVATVPLSATVPPPIATLQPATPTTAPTATRRPQPTPTVPKATVPPTAPPPIPVPTDIIRESSRGQGQGITAKFIYPNYSPEATNSLVFRVIAYESKGPQTDGAGIKNVAFKVCRDNCGDDRNIVYQRTEQNAAYCTFGGGEPTCNVFTFKRGSYWPDTQTPVQDGNYVVEATATSKNNSNFIWTGQINFKIKLS